MSEIAVATINSFGLPDGQVQPDDQLVLTRGQLREIVSQATAPLLERIERLENEQTVLCENQFIQLKLVNQIRKNNEPQPLQRDRGEILKALVAANGGKMLAKDARQRMRLSKPLFSMLLTTLKDDIKIKPLHSDHRMKFLVLKTS
jgi:hypothetical protein